MHIYTRRMTSVYSLIRKTFVESAQTLTLRNICWRKAAQHITVTHPCGGHAQSCLTLAAFENECSCSAPRTALLSADLTAVRTGNNTGHCHSLRPRLRLWVPSLDTLTCLTLSCLRRPVMRLARTEIPGGGAGPDLRGLGGPGVSSCHSL